MDNINNFRKNLRILLVEDDYLTQKKLVRILSKRYKDIVVAKNGDDALKIYRDFYVKNRFFDLVISDINMPIMDGIELLENIREVDESLPFIFVTAQMDVSNILKSIKLDIDDYILKPIDIEVLFDGIDRVIKKSFKKRFLKEEKKHIKLGDKLIWDSENKLIYKDGEFVKLTKKEILLIDLLCDNLNKIISTENIIFLLWEDSFDVESNIANLKNLISRLRIKLPSLYIENVYGMGYKIKV